MAARVPASHRRAARGGSRTLAELRAAEKDKRSRLPATVDLLLRQPALTAPALARRLDITPQATLRLFARLEQAGLVREVTSRDSFRRSPSLFGQEDRLQRESDPIAAQTLVCHISGYTQF